MLLWPLLEATEFKPWLLLEADSLRASSAFLASFWPLAHEPAFLLLVAQETWRTVAMATAGVALGWLLAQGPDVVPIPGVKRRVTMEDSVLAADLVLDAEDLAALDAASPKGATAGPRYGEMGMRMVRI